MTVGAGLRPTAKAVEWPPDPTVRAPVFYPTGSPGRVTARGHTAHPSGAQCKSDLPLKVAWHGTFPLEILAASSGLRGEHTIVSDAVLPAR